jgi:hypothetical protein
MGSARIILHRHHSRRHHFRHYSRHHRFLYSPLSSIQLDEGGNHIDFPQKHDYDTQKEKHIYVMNQSSLSYTTTVDRVLELLLVTYELLAT